jgi:hypothetical protein
MPHRLVADTAKSNWKVDAILNSAPILVLILLADFAITSLHSYQEWKGVGAPLWRNFGAIVGLDIPGRWGFLFFTALLTLTLFAIGFVGITGLLCACLTAAVLGSAHRRAIDRYGRVARLAVHRRVSPQSRAIVHATLRS